MFKKVHSIYIEKVFIDQILRVTAEYFIVKCYHYRWKMSTVEESIIKLDRLNTNL